MYQNDFLNMILRSKKEGILEIYTIMDYISVEERYIFSSWLSIMKIRFPDVYLKNLNLISVLVRFYNYIENKIIY